jgi:hypothetical protein
MFHLTVGRSGRTSTPHRERADRAVSGWAGGPTRRLDSPRGSVYVTKPYPLLRPVSRSVIIFTCTTDPACCVFVGVYEGRV